MSKIICSICNKVHEDMSDGKYPRHPDQENKYHNFINSDEYLKKETERVARGENLWVLKVW